MILLLVLAAGPCLAGIIDLDVNLKTNKAANVKGIFYQYGEAPPDTAGLPWSAPKTDHSGIYNTGIDAAVANADSGGIVLTWDPATNHQGYMLKFNPNDQGWADVADLPPEAITYHHEISDAVKPRRGVINYCIYAFTVSGSDTTWSAVAVLPSYFLNQSVMIAAQFDASVEPGKDETKTGVEYWLHISYWNAPPDDPPAAPKSLVATAGDGSVELDWEDNIEPDLNTYSLYRGISAGMALLFKEDIAKSGYSDGAVTNDSTYYYTVTAVDAIGQESPHSNEANATPAGGGTIPGTPVHHWDCMDGSTLTLNGTTAELWEDQVGSLDVEDHNDVDGPDYSTSHQINGHTALYFDGANYLFNAYYVCGGSDYSFGIVFDATNDDRWELFNIAGSDIRYCCPAGRGDTGAYFYQVDPHYFGDATTYDGQHTLIVTYNNTTNEYSGWVDGINVLDKDTFGQTIPSTGMKLNIGSRYRGSSTYGFTGCVGEIILYDSLLNDADVAQLHSYFGRWN